MEAKATHSVGALLADVSRLLRRNFNRRAQSLGLTQAQWLALARLSRNEGINQACLADQLEVQPITLARLVDRLEANGWVERRPDPSDRRAQRLFLTPQVAPLLERMNLLASETREEAMAGLPEAARRQLVETLSVMKSNLVHAEAGRA
jgi:MarR family transcriptional regulator for hemolysin